MPEAEDNRFGPLLYYKSRLVECFRTTELEGCIDPGVLAELRRLNVVVIADLRDCNVVVTSNKDAFDRTAEFVALFRGFAAAFTQYHKKPGDDDNDDLLSWVCCDDCHKWRITTRAIVKRVNKTKRFKCPENAPGHANRCADPAEVFDETKEVTRAFAIERGGGREGERQRGWGGRGREERRGRRRRDSVARRTQSGSLWRTRLQRPRRSCMHCARRRWTKRTWSSTGRDRM